MALNKGKKFEAVFEAAWSKQYGKNSLLRLPDQMSGYKIVSQNPCDYVCYKKPYLYLIECKETTSSTLNWSAFPQYDRLSNYVDVDGIIAGVLIWFSKHDKVAFVSIKDCIKMHNENKKSINVKDIDNDNYHILDVKCEIKRIYPVLDLSDMVALPEGW